VVSPLAAYEMARGWQTLKTIGQNMGSDATNLSCLVEAYAKNDDR
jgi:hypothetical protein